MNQQIYTEVVVIGGGPSGYSAAFRCSDLGLQTVLIEQFGKLGGVCLNVGCIPSKALLHIAKTINDSKKLSNCGVFFNQLDVDINKIRRWKNNLIKCLSDSLFDLSKYRKVQILHGTAEFSDKNHLTVYDNELRKTDVFFKKAIIATGSIPVTLEHFSYDDKRIWTSSEALNISIIPKKMLIIGSGIIGLEMATIYSALGSKVDIIESNSTILPKVDTDITTHFIKAVSTEYNIIFNTKVINLKACSNDIKVTLQTDKDLSIIREYDVVLIAVGRKTCLKSLNVNNIGLKIDPFGFIKVDKQLRTNIENIYAVGDIIGEPMLAHKGIYQGKIVAEVISGKKVFFDPLVIPSIAYTDPELAWVGITEKEAIKNNISYKTSVFPWAASGRAMTSNAQHGKTKLIFDKISNRIIGGIVLGSNAGELLGEISLAIEMGCDAEDVSLTMHAHPTLYETIGLSSEVFQGISTDLLNS